jgi:hypothetical protein
MFTAHPGNILSIDTAKISYVAAAIGSRIGIDNVTDPIDCPPLRVKRGKVKASRLFRARPCESTQLTTGRHENCDCLRDKINFGAPA